MILHKFDKILILYGVKLHILRRCDFKIEKQNMQKMQ